MGTYNSQYGYGICIDDIKVTKENAYMDFVKKFQLFGDLNISPTDESLTNMDYQDIVEEFEDDSCIEGLPALLSIAAYDKYKVELETVIAESGMAYLVVLKKYPWEYNKETLACDLNDIDKIIADLVEPLTDDVLEIHTWEIEEWVG